MPSKRKRTARIKKAAKKSIHGYEKTTWKKELDRLLAEDSKEKCPVSIKINCIKEKE